MPCRMLSQDPQQRPIHPVLFWELARQLALGLMFLENSNIVHLDIKVRTHPVEIFLLLFGATADDCACDCT